MSYIGGGMYDASICPLCGSVMWNGVCENLDCHHHWHPYDEESDEIDENEKRFRFWP